MDSARGGEIMRIHEQPKFSIGALYVARRDFKWNGEWVRRGDFFPVAGREARAKAMYNARYIRLADSNESARYFRGVRDEPDMAEPAEDVGAAPPADLEVRMRGSRSGWYDVVGPDGAPVNEKPLRKKAAEALAAGN